MKHGTGEDITRLELELQALKTRYTILNDKASYQLGLIKDVPGMIEQFHDSHRLILTGVAEIEQQLSIQTPVTDVDAYLQVSLLLTLIIYNLQRRRTRVADASLGRRD